MTIDHLAARLAGGFTKPIEADALHDAVKAALAETALGELERIKYLPGMTRAAVGTLRKVWQAGIDLRARSDESRPAALAALEQAVLSRLPSSMKPSPVLAEIALQRIRHAPAVIGPIEVHAHSELPPCWHRLLIALAEVVHVTWFAGPRRVPEWLRGSDVEIRTSAAEAPEIRLLSCANPMHETTEALRWARSLIASGRARPEEIAIVAASPAELDDHIQAIRRETNLPVHFVHGIKAITEYAGQAVAALAELLLNGLSQARVRRLFRLLHGRSPALVSLPPDWTTVLSTEAALTTLDRWTHALTNCASGWPGGIDRSALVLDVLSLLARGSDAAAEIGERLLTGLALKLWRRALIEGPATALPVSLAELRVPDTSEPATGIIWCSAAALASAPRPFVWVIGLNSGHWPRRITEDRLIPDHVIRVEELDPLPMAEADHRDFETIKATTARRVVLSYSRRDVEGRLLGRSPLIAGMEEVYLARGRIPEHAASEADRLLARPREFAAAPIGRSGLYCWRDWYRDALTPHDGLTRAGHPRIAKALARTQSASSLRLLLRDPIRFVWKYALGWRQPNESEDPITLKPLAFGNLVHEVLREVVDTLEQESGLANASASRIEDTIHAGMMAVARRWEAEAPVPPPITWANAQRRAREMALRALTYPLDCLPGQRSWTEIPFGLSAESSADYRNLPWDATRRVEIPGAGVAITGYIDRLDIAGDGGAVRVIDYKTGKIQRDQADICLRGGDELQRCLYAFAVISLLGLPSSLDVAFLYPRVNGGLFALADVDRLLGTLASAISIARGGVETGLALPGIDAVSQFNEFVFALPANAKSGYLVRKLMLFVAGLGEAIAIWDAP
jgi:hypothetical protein